MFKILLSCSSLLHIESNRIASVLQHQATKKAPAKLLCSPVPFPHGSTDKPPKIGKPAGYEVTILVAPCSVVILVTSYPMCLPGLCAGKAQEARSAGCLTHCNRYSPDRGTTR